MIYRILISAVIAGALWFHGYSIGEDNVQVKWNAEKHTQQIVAEITKRKQAEAGVQVVTKYVDRIKYVRTQGQTIERKVVEYVPSNSCMLPSGFRLLHDDAASGNTDPFSTRDTYDEAVDAQTVASTVIENYTSCRQNAVQLEMLQEWVSKVSSPEHQK